KGSSWGPSCRALFNFPHPPWGAAWAPALEEGKAAAPPTKLVFGNCWGCRILSGSALIGAGYWVYLGPRRVLGRGFTPSPWTIFQLSFAVSLACLGVVILVDPAVKQK
uniref:Distal membrane-arm assembly complex protein 1-like domain-containing protein n=1 Tax=Chelydra serpentina TaxID=8475 RepID=A0A8C3XS00_CHESE